MFIRRVTQQLPKVQEFMQWRYMSATLQNRGGPKTSAPKVGGPPSSYIQSHDVAPSAKTETTETMEENYQINLEDKEELTNYFTIRDITADMMLHHKKKSGLVTVTADETILNAIEVMSNQDIGALVVLKRKDDFSSYCGILSERDFVSKVIVQAKDSTTIKVEQIMTPVRDLITVGLDTRLSSCAQVMKNHGIRHLPVLNNAGNTLVGIVSVDDVLYFIESEYKRNILGQEYD